MSTQRHLNLSTLTLPASDGDYSIPDIRAGSSTRSAISQMIHRRAFSSTTLDRDLILQRLSLDIIRKKYFE